MEISLIGEALDFGSNDYRFESYISNIQNYLFNSHTISMTRDSKTYLINSVNRRNIQKPIGIFIKTNSFILELLKIFKY